MAVRYGHNCGHRRSCLTSRAGPPCLLPVLPAVAAGWDSWGNGGSTHGGGGKAAARSSAAGTAGATHKSQSMPQLNRAATGGSAGNGGGSKRGVKEKDEDAADEWGKW